MCSACDEMDELIRLADEVAGAYPEDARVARLAQLAKDEAERTKDTIAEASWAE